MCCAWRIVSHYSPIAGSSPRHHHQTVAENAPARCCVAWPCNRNPASGDESSKFRSVARLGNQTETRTATPAANQGNIASFLPPPFMRSSTQRTAPTAQNPASGVLLKVQLKPPPIPPSRSSSLALNAANLSVQLARLRHPPPQPARKARRGGPATDPCCGPAQPPLQPPAPRSHNINSSSSLSRGGS